MRRLVVLLWRAGVAACRALPHLYWRRRGLQAAVGGLVPLLAFQVDSAVFSVATSPLLPSSSPLPRLLPPLLLLLPSLRFTPSSM